MSVLGLGPYSRLRTASRISWVTSSGWLMNTPCELSISTVADPARAAIARSAPGGITISDLIVSTEIKGRRHRTARVYVAPSRGAFGCGMLLTYYGDRYIILGMGLLACH